MFTSDRDLITLEPNLFRDVSWVGQQILRATGSLSGGFLNLASGSYTAAGVTTGHIALVDNVPVEILSITNATKAAVSLIRADPTGAAVPPADAASKPVVITTFAPQTAIVHLQLLRMLGIDPNDPADPSGQAITEAKIKNARSLWLIEALGALHLIHTAAAALAGDDSPAGRRATLYRERFAHERQRAAAHIDTDADGLPDIVRRFNAAQFIRD